MHTGICGIRGKMNSGHMAAVALPSSLATLEAYDDLLNYSGGSFTYTFYSGTNQISQRTTTLPLISAAQNGSRRQVMHA
jgi:hypothetical protein